MSKFIFSDDTPENIFVEWTLELIVLFCMKIISEFSHFFLILGKHSIRFVIANMHSLIREYNHLFLPRVNHLNRLLYFVWFS